MAGRARQLGLDVHQPPTVRAPEFLDWFRGRAPEAGVVVAYGELLPRALLQAASRGFVNLHFSLLPRYRGAAPVQWAIASGERTTGVTTMAIAPKLDAGDIYLQSEVPMEPGETAPSLASCARASGSASSTPRRATRTPGSRRA